jgi:hypothetical protein
MWQAKGIEENVHNVVGVITRNLRRCLVACIVRCVSCWHVLTSARQILHSTKGHPNELCQMQAPSYGNKFSVFCVLLIVIHLFMDTELHFHVSRFVSGQYGTVL